MKRWTVSFHPTFRAALLAQEAWLQDHARTTWVEGLREGIADAAGLLTTLPRAGVLDGAGPLRTLLLRRLPFTLWYALDEPAREVVVLRLFHVRQYRPRGRR